MKNKGFSLIEFMIIFAIALILAAIAMPFIVKYKERAAKIETTTINSPWINATNNNTPIYNIPLTETITSNITPDSESSKTTSNDTDTQRVKFIKFLVMNDAHELWLENIKNCGKDINGFLNRTYPHDYIYRAFVFEDTKQGNSFWQDLHNKWELELEDELSFDGDTISIAIPATGYIGQEIEITVDGCKTTINKAEQTKGDFTMINFLFGTLGSVIFWLVYGGLSMVAITLILKKLSPQTFGWITGKYKLNQVFPDGDEPFAFIILFLISLFWPVIVLFWILGLVIKILFFKGFCSMVKAIDKSLPEIKIVKHDEDE